MVGDEAADLLIEYAARLANAHVADSVHLYGINTDGNTVSATLLLSGGTPLMSETATTALPEPDNSEAVQVLTGNIDRLPR